MTEHDYRMVISVCMALVLLLAPFAGIHRAVRRLRAKAASSSAPIVAAAIAAADAVAGLAGLFSQPVALLAVLLPVIRLAAALASNALVRRGRVREAKAAAAPPPQQQG